MDGVASLLIAGIKSLADIDLQGATIRRLKRCQIAVCVSVCYFVPLSSSQDFAELHVDTPGAPQHVGIYVHNHH